MSASRTLGHPRHARQIAARLAVSALCSLAQWQWAWVRPTRSRTPEEGRGGAPLPLSATGRGLPGLPLSEGPSAPPRRPAAPRSQCPLTCEPHASGPGPRWPASSCRAACAAQWPAWRAAASAGGGHSPLPPPPPPSLRCPPCADPLRPPTLLSGQYGLKFKAGVICSAACQYDARSVKARAAG
jgi:hypothetical protein